MRELIIKDIVKLLEGVDVIKLQIIRSFIGGITRK